MPGSLFFLTSSPTSFFCGASTPGATLCAVLP